jgi:hypothetical protein
MIIIVRLIYKTAPTFVLHQRQLPTHDLDPNRATCAVFYRPPLHEAHLAPVWRLIWANCEAIRIILRDGRDKRSYFVLDLHKCSFDLATF